MLFFLSQYFDGQPLETQANTENLVNMQTCSRCAMGALRLKKMWTSFEGQIYPAQVVVLRHRVNFLG